MQQQTPNLNLLARLAALHGTPDLLTSALECTTLGAELQLVEGVLIDWQNVPCIKNNNM